MTIAQTSLFAYESITPTDLNIKQQKVFAFIRDHPGCTNEEISQGTGMRLQSVTPRTGELRAIGCIAVSGQKKMSSGRYAMTYEVISNEVSN